MKNIGVLIMLFFFLSTVTGCQKSIEPSPIQKEFTASVRCGEEGYTVTCNGTGVISICYDFPEQLQGLTYSYQGNHLTVKYGILHYVPCANLPENHVSQLYEILSSINDDTEQHIRVCDTEKTIYSLPSYEITCSTKGGKIQNIYKPDTNQRYEFS